MILLIVDWLIPQIEHRPFIVMSRSSHSWKIRWHSASLSFMTFPPLYSDEPKTQARKYAFIVAHFGRKWYTFFAKKCTIFLYAVLSFQTKSAFGGNDRLHAKENRPCLLRQERYFMERATRLELATSTLARWRSTG